MRKIISICLVFAITLLGCTNQVQNIEPTVSNEEATRLDVVSSVAGLDLTKEELAYLDTLQEKGVLRVASRTVPTVLSDQNGEYVGFNYATIKQFTDALGLELDIKIVENIEEYFSYEGSLDPAVMTDETLKYKPDLFNEVDVYVDTLTQLPWREKLMDFIGFTPIRELILHKPGIDINTLSDLDKKTVAVQSISSYMTTIDQLVKTHGFQFKYIYTDTITDALNAVKSGEADFTIMDSNRAFLEAKNTSEFQVSIPITDVKFVGWAVSKDNPLLRSVLQKYIDHMIDEGDINQLWLEDFDISFYEYYTLILKDSNIIDAMNLTAEELAYLDDLRDRGYINFAMQNNVIGYQVDSDNQTGYNYLLARDFADFIDVELELTIVDQFTKYFWLNGETPAQIKTDPSFTYVPDMFKTVDVYADNLTHVPWRQQILYQLKGVPVSVVLVQDKSLDISTMADLDGLTIALNRDTSHELVLQDIEDEYGIKLNIFEVYNDTEGFEAVANGDADLTLSDSDLGFLYLQNYDTLEIEFQASKSDFVGWAVQKDNLVLASILEKYIEAMKDSGKFDAYWELCYGVSYPEYMRLMTE